MRARAAVVVPLQRDAAKFPGPDRRGRNIAPSSERVDRRTWRGWPFRADGTLSWEIRAGRAWALAGDAAPGAGGGPVTVDLYATLVTALEKEQATRPGRRRSACHDDRLGRLRPRRERPARVIGLRVGDAGSNAAAAADDDEAAVWRWRSSRADCAAGCWSAPKSGGTHEFLAWLTSGSRPLHYFVGITITKDIEAATGKVPASGWTPAYDGGGRLRGGGWVADITGLPDLESWPARMRVIVRKERPHSGAQLRFTDIDGHRFTCFATDARRGQLADRELRRRRRASCEDRILPAPPGTPGCETSRSRGPRRTRSGTRSWPWPASSWPGPRSSPWPATPTVGNRNGCARASSPSPAGSSGVAAASGCGSPGTGPGPRKSPQPSPARRPSPPASRPQQPIGQEGETSRAVGPGPLGATAGQPAMAGTENRPPASTSGQHVRRANDRGLPVIPMNPRVPGRPARLGAVPVPRSARVDPSHTGQLRIQPGRNTARTPCGVIALSPLDGDRGLQLLSPP